MHQRAFIPGKVRGALIPPNKVIPSGKVYDRKGMKLGTRLAQDDPGGPLEPNPGKAVAETRVCVKGEGKRCKLLEFC